VLVTAAHHVTVVAVNQRNQHGKTGSNSSKMMGSPTGVALILPVS